MLNDVVWSNKGDTYITVTFTQPLPLNITLTANLGYYIYNKEGRYLGTRDTEFGVECGAGQAFIINGCFEGKAPVGSAYRHFIVGLSQPIGKTGLVWTLQGILPGENRFGVRQQTQGIAQLSYMF
jgi:hypothetical protein